PPNEMRVEDVSSLDRQPGALLGRKTLVDCERECLGAKFARIPSCRISAAIAGSVLSPRLWRPLFHIQASRYLRGQASRIACPVKSRGHAQPAWEQTCGTLRKFSSFVLATPSAAKWRKGSCEPWRARRSSR